MICYFTPEDYGSFTAISTTFSGRYAETESVARRTRSAWRKSHREAREARLIHQIHQLKIEEFTSKAKAVSLSKDFYMFPANLIAARTRFLMLEYARKYARNITLESHNQNIETFLYFIRENAISQKDPKASKIHACLLIDLLQLQPVCCAHERPFKIILRNMMLRNFHRRQDFSKESILAQSRIRSFLDFCKTISQLPNLRRKPRIVRMLTHAHKESIEYYFKCINSNPENIAKLSDNELKDALKIYAILLRTEGLPDLSTALINHYGLATIHYGLATIAIFQDEQQEFCNRLIEQIYNEMTPNQTYNEMTPNI